MSQPILQHHYEDMPKQRHAGRLGMWLFLGSELLFFAGLFALYAYYRTEHPDVFREAVRHNNRWLGTINTAVLIFGSVCVGSGANLLRLGRLVPAAWLVLLTALSGLAYIVIKSVEWVQHFGEGIFPGGVGTFFLEHREPGWPIFFTLYYGMTGMHVIHVAIGVVMLGWMAWWMVRDEVGPLQAHKVAFAGLYWHFVDIIWLFLWPIFYLMGTRA